MTMVRKQVFITASQDRKLKLRARATNQAVAEIIRDAIDKELGEPVGDDWKAKLLSVAGALRENNTIEATVADNRRRWDERLDQTAKKLRDPV